LGWGEGKTVINLFLCILIFLCRDMKYYSLSRTAIYTEIHEIQSKLICTWDGVSSHIWVDYITALQTIIIPQ